MKKSGSNTNSFPIYRVDAFTDTVFSGNPAGVCLLNQPVDAEVMQQIAAEVNLSETAFLTVPNWVSLKATSTFPLRWFTPVTEVPLCGHATLAGAAVLFYELGVSSPVLQFDTSSGSLGAQVTEAGISLNFPAYLCEDYEPPRVLLSALGISSYRRCLYSAATGTLLIHISSDDFIRTLSPHFEQLFLSVGSQKIQGVIVTARGNQPYDFVSRFFAPWLGINEDPVTGSAHTLLGPYWAEILNKKVMKAFQVSLRGGVIDVELLPENRILLTGKAVIVFRGNIHIKGYGSSDSGS